MHPPAAPRPEFREAFALLVLGAVLTGSLFWHEPRPGPGPLGMMVQVSLLHLLLFGPSLSSPKAHWAWGVLPLALALPAVAATSYGHETLLPTLWLLLLGAVAGAAGRSLRGRPGGALYLPLTLLVLFAPYALHYLLVEFGEAPGADAWLRASPLVAGGLGEMPPVAAVLLLIAPVWAIATGRRT